MIDGGASPDQPPNHPPYARPGLWGYATGDRLMERGILHTIPSLHDPCVPASSPDHRFSPRQREVLARLSRGHKTREIAEALGISRKTVEKHCQNLQQVLGIEGLYPLIVFAVHYALAQDKDGGVLSD
jgi:DNA-binding NarL/FixJ family response regulator